MQSLGKHHTVRLIRTSGIIFALFFLVQNAAAQGYVNRTELGIYGGGSYYIGDLNPDRHFVDSRPSFGIIYRRNLTLRHSLRFTAFYGEVTANDADATLEQQVNRNLSFKSSLFELAVGYEINLFKYNISNMDNPISPYFFYQIAYTRMNPTAEYEGSEVALQPLGTEGQGTSASSKGRYNLNQLTVPLGIGVKMNIKDRLAISVEYGIRKTFTDYLDDASGDYVDQDILRAENGPLAADLSDRSLDGTIGMNRGNPNNKDWYAFYGFMITFKPFKYDVCNHNKGGVVYF